MSPIFKFIGIKYIASKSAALEIAMGIGIGLIGLVVLMLCSLIVGLALWTVTGGAILKTVDGLMVCGLLFMIVSSVLAKAIYAIHKVSKEYRLFKGGLFKAFNPRTCITTYYICGKEVSKQEFESTQKMEKRSSSDA